VGYTEDGEDKKSQSFAIIDPVSEIQWETIHSLWEPKIVDRIRDAEARISLTSGKIRDSLVLAYCKKLAI
jgi:hypothetical protein